MGRKSRTKQESSGVPTPASKGSATRNLPLLILAVIGILLTSYILYTDYIGSQLRGCSVGSACDIVLSSKWAHLFGAPTAFWGWLTYITFAVLALRWKPGRWRIAWAFAVFGFVYSAYLTTVSLTILKAACPYCLTSLTLMTIITAVTTFQRPEMPGLSFGRTAGTVIGGALAFIIVAHLNYTGVLGEPPTTEDPRLKAIALHLDASGAKMYGASWCPHCQQQKEMFGLAAKRLPYIECSPGGQGAPQAAVCRNLGITTYPTWIIDGKRMEEVIPPQKLAEMTGFKDEPVPAPAP